MIEILEKQPEECQDCGHERKYHMNLVGCCYPIVMENFLQVKIFGGQ